MKKREEWGWEGKVFKVCRGILYMLFMLENIDPLRYQISIPRSFFGHKFHTPWGTQVYIMWFVLDSTQGIILCTPYQRTPMGNPHKTHYIVGIYGFFHPQESHPRTPAKCHGYTYVRSTPLLVPWNWVRDGVQHASWHPLKHCMMVGSPHPQGWVWKL